jgi:hypothetical protein
MRRRGDAATQTSDARFDEKFQFGHGLTGTRLYLRPLRVPCSMQALLLLHARSLCSILRS